jgi:hypothetical protein
MHSNYRFGAISYGAKTEILAALARLCRRVRDVIFEVDPGWRPLRGLTRG